MQQSFDSFFTMKCPLPDLLEDSVAIVIEFSCLNSLQYRSIMQKVPIT